MINNQELIERSKDLAKKTLEATILPLALTLNLDTSNLSSSFIIPVESDDLDYNAYVALRNMCASLEKLQ